MMCDKCGHSEVCKNREMMESVCKAISDLSIGTGNHTIWYVRDIPWIESVEPRCKNFIQKKTINIKGGVQ